MKEDVVSNGSNGSAGSKRSKLRFLDLSFEGKEVAFKNGDLDNGRFPHGGYKGSKKHPLSLYTFDKGREYQRQLRDDLDLEMEREEVGEFGGSPTWALEAHRWPTHSGESPLLAHRFLATSKLEAVNGISNRLTRDTGTKSGTKLGAPAAGTGTNGLVYYRPNRTHHYLTATDVPKDVSDCGELVRFGRPTRTTLLRARQKVGLPAANAYELRRQLDQRMDEIRMGCVFSNPKELIQLPAEVDGESFYSFLTGARYNRAHYLDSRVYMPRHNVLGSFVVGPKGDILDTTSAPPDSPRSDTEEGLSPNAVDDLRPTTAPGYGKKTLAPVPPVPVSLPPRQAWGDASTSLHVSNGDAKKVENDNSSNTPLLQDIRVSSPQLRIRGSRVPLSVGREGPYRFENHKLPSVHVHSLSKLPQLKETTTDDTSDLQNQPPPTPLTASVKVDNTSLPAVVPEAETEAKANPQTDQMEAKTKSETPLLAPVEADDSVSPAASAGEQKVEGEEEKAEEVKKEETTDKIQKEETEQKDVEEEEKQKEEDITESIDTQKANVEEEKTEKQNTGDDDTQKTSADEEEQNVEESPEEDSALAQTTSAADDAATPREKTSMSDDVKFFLTEGAGVTDNTEGDVITSKMDAVPDHTDTDTANVRDDDGSRPMSNARSMNEKENVENADTDVENTNQDATNIDLNAGEEENEREEEEKEQEEEESPRAENTTQEEENTISDLEGGVSQNEATFSGTEAPDTDVDEGQGHTEPLKVIVTHIEKGMATPSQTEEEEEEIITKDP